MRFTSIAAFILFFSTVMAAQVSYERNSMTVFFLNLNEKHGNLVKEAFKNLEPPEKYYNNPVDDNILKSGFSRQPAPEGLEMFFLTVSDEDIENALKENKTGQKILSTWFNRQKDGSFNVDNLKQRGLYNATDQDFIVASSSKRGDATLMDMGLNLVGHSYVLVFDFYEILTMEEYYDKMKTESEKRTSNGFKAKVRSYLYQLQFEEEEASEFFNKYWITENDAAKTEKIRAFENAEFRFMRIGKQTANTDITQLNSLTKQKSPNQMMETLVKTVMENINEQIETQKQEFRVKAMVCGTKPIASKIGKKEGLDFDRRYFVYENRMRKNGKTYKKRIGVVKSMKVVDNRRITTGETEPSLFYQIAGRKIDDLGMYLEQKNDKGFNIHLGYVNSGLKGGNLLFEYYISRFMGDIIGSGKSGKALRSFTFYLGGTYGSNDYFSFENSFGKHTFMNISLWLGKDFYPARFMHWGPYLGYGLELTSWADSDNSIETDFFESGLRLGINLSYRTQLMGSYGFAFKISSKVKNIDKEVIDDYFDYNWYFPDRMGSNSSFGIRIMF